MRSIIQYQVYLLHTLKETVLTHLVVCIPERSFQSRHRQAVLPVAVKDAAIINGGRDDRGRATARAS